MDVIAISLINRGKISSDVAAEHNTKSRNKAARRPITVRYYHTNHVGAPVELTGKDGVVGWRSDHPDRAQSGGNLAVFARRHTGGVLDRDLHQPLRLMGHYHDAETGMHYAHQRHYDPDSRRFVAQETIHTAAPANE